MTFAIPPGAMRTGKAGPMPAAAAKTGWYPALCGVVVASADLSAEAATRCASCEAVVASPVRGVHR